MLKFRFDRRMIGDQFSLFEYAVNLLWNTCKKKKKKKKIIIIIIIINKFKKNVYMYHVFFFTAKE